MDEIDKIKQKYKNGSEFVSSNDILCHLTANLNPKCTQSLVVLDLRRRLSQLDENYAGNYITYLLLYKDDFESPQSIRARVKDITDA